MKKFCNSILEINKKILKKKIHYKYKKDKSAVSNLDLELEKEITKSIRFFFPDIDQIISEENFKNEKLNKLDFKKPFAIFDPIDGTENFISGLDMFGQTISIRSFKKGYFDLIFLPKQNIMLTTKNILKKKRKNFLKITSVSSKMIGHRSKNIKNKDNYRIFGSLAFSFCALLLGKINKIDYSSKAKIWEYYTGLSLCKTAGFKIVCDNNRWYNNPKYKMKFSVCG